MNQPASSGKTRFASLALAALGVVYGDIGTSPLYALKEVFGNAHHPVPISPDNVLGILSLVTWALMIVITGKYVSFVMRADNRGEGGIMALMALALRDMPAGKGRNILVMLGLFGAALFYGDGVITPAVSVLSAVEGLEIVTPAFKPYVIPIALVVLVFLFLLQRHGTASVGKLFGPVMMLWFAVLCALGFASIANEPGVLRALNPAWGGAFLAAHPGIGFFSLGAVVLVLTGGEALYADMGHFGRVPIQVVWCGLVLPALLVNYYGQGALLLADPSAIENPFYLLAPGWATLPLVLLSTAATIIASQAVISGAFSMTLQAMQLGYSPRFEVRHTSEREIGQIYLPAINWLLLAAVIALVIGFGSSSNLAAAYGIAVTGTMLITNLLAFVVARRQWGWSRALALSCIVPFVLIDVAFFSANSTKIFDGGWFPLAFGALVFTVLTTWKRGREVLHEKLGQESIALAPFIDSLALGGATRVPGTAVFLTGRPEGVPRSLLHSLKHYKVLHERMVLVTIRIFDVPHVPEIDRVEVKPLGQDFWLVTVQYGFKDEPDLPEALTHCAEVGLDFDMMDTSFFLGRETLIPRFGKEMAYWRVLLFAAMFRNATSITAFFRVPSNRVVELGSQVVL
ncbi:potassium transporter Kup [Propionivibrio dicarboxylicus]|uniref:Probable potassium transport system protein Kup n=1 Tax=Propionivibrio dicarboxylicus TaxID=83767 RepID=A0A1G7V0F5_9RHOO|nr:potassium transporter Kup [Propionivibrio dicarboxylicus]SDG53236.1 KUP system potassium uptake protein [Propionivibrio dicarboxylicus]